MFATGAAKYACTSLKLWKMPWSFIANIILFKQPSHLAWKCLYADPDFLDCVIKQNNLINDNLIHNNLIHIV